MRTPILAALALLVVAVGGATYLLQKHRDHRPPAVRRICDAHYGEVKRLAADLFERCRERSLAPTASPFKGTDPDLERDPDVLEAELVCRDLIPGLGIGVTLPPLHNKSFDDVTLSGTAYAPDGHEPKNPLERRAYAVAPSLLFGPGAVDLCVLEDVPPETAPSRLCVTYRTEDDRAEE